MKRLPRLALGMALLVPVGWTAPGCGGGEEIPIEPADPVAISPAKSGKETAPSKKGGPPLKGTSGDVNFDPAHPPP